MLNKKEQAVADLKTLETFRSTIAQALTFLQQSSTATSLHENPTTLQSSLLDAIFEIDSQPDIEDPFLDPQVGAEEALAEAGQLYGIGTTSVARRIGKIQRVRALKVALFGGKATVVELGVRRVEVVPGLFEAVKSVAGVAEDDIK